MSMKRIYKSIIATVMAMATLTATVFPAYAAQFGNVLDGNGIWSDTNNLTWTFNNGGSVTIGRGPVFSNVHPEITDPEYFLKESILYPGETIGAKNSAGGYKADYSEALPLLQEFVNSFDWIHSDELTRLQKVFERIANGQSGNTEGSPVASSFPVLQYGKGVCMSFASDFQRLASYVGLESVTYDQSAVHVACLVKINGQWITVDPYVNSPLFNNLRTVPVDYETEYNRYANEVNSSQWYQDQKEEFARADELKRRWEAGELTEEEYLRLLYPYLSEEKIQEMVDWDGYVEGLGNN